MKILQDLVLKILKNNNPVYCKNSFVGSGSLCIQGLIIVPPKHLAQPVCSAHMSVTSYFL